MAFGFFPSQMKLKKNETVGDDDAVLWLNAVQITTAITAATTVAVVQSL